MTVSSIFCDKCGDTVCNEESFYPRYAMHLIKENSPDFKATKQYDLCEKCYKNICEGVEKVSLNKDPDWNFDVKAAEEMQWYILFIRDDSGDSPYDHVTVGYKVQNTWVVDNDYVAGTVLAFKDLPKPPKYEKK